MAMRRRLAGACIVAASLVAACGGSGGGDGAEPPPPAPSGLCATPGAGYTTYAKAGATTGQSGAVTIAGCSGAIESPQWVQTGGPPVVELIADKSQTLSFYPLTAGRHTFRVTFRDPAGMARSEEVAMDVGAASSDTRMALRVSQSVRMGGNVSVRAWPALRADEAVQSIAWSQIEGPAVTLDTGDMYAALFKAPAQVSHDTLIRLRATLTTTAGRSASDEALVLVERHPQAAASDSAALWAGDHVSRVHAYRPAGPYAAVLQRCVYDSGLRDNGTTSTLCPLSQLPFLAQEVGTGVPSVEQVMNRVVVSHDWIGRNFEAFLNTHDTQGDFRRMLKSVTAIVIGAQVRPSFYYPATGAIYLDADNFWLTPEERDTVNEAPDFRSNFGATLQYTTLWRYVAGNQSIFRFYDPRRRVPRASGALLEEAGWLMFHELGHALDFVPPSTYGTLQNARTAWGNIEPRYSAGQLASDTVPALHPLTSTVMAGLGQVRFFGATASAAQNAYTPAQVAAFFAADLATDDYAYATRREDVAMTLEEFLVSRRLGYRRDFAVTARPGPGATGSTIAVVWGQRGRIAEPALRPRLRAVVQQLTPWIDPAEVDQLPPPIAMRAGDSWTGNLSLPAPPPPTPQRAKPEATLEERWLLEQAERRRQRLLPWSKPLPKQGAGAPASTVSPAR
jgi:hypothetical protein